MAIFITGDTHGDFGRLLPAAFHEQRDLTKEDYLILCGDYTEFRTKPILDAVGLAVHIIVTAQSAIESGCAEFVFFA